MTTKATRDVIDLKTRPINVADSNGIEIDGDCGSNFSIDGVPIGLNTACSAAFLDITMSGNIAMAGNDIDMDGGKVLNASDESGPAGDPWITTSVSDANDASTLETANNFTEALIQQSVPTGVVLPFAGPSAPSGFILCGGQEVNRVTFARLFDVVGTTYGPGDGSTTFNVPDLRGRVPAGMDNVGGVPANRLTPAWAGFLGGVGGVDSNSESFSYSGNQTINGTTGAPSHQDSEGAGAFSGAADNHTHNFTVNVSWSGNTTPTDVSKIQPTMVMNYIIRA